MSGFPGAGASIPSAVVDLDNAIVVKKPQDFINPSSTKAYILDGVIDFTGSGLSIEVPAGGLRIIGLGLDQFGIICTDDNYSLFTTPSGGAGNLFMEDFSITVSGTNSKVYDLTGATGFEAVEMQVLNFNNCTSLGGLTDYRQLLESNSGRFGGKPELTFSGAWNGARISTSIVRGIGDITALFKAGSSLTFDGRFLTDINCDLPAIGALIDFSAANITNDESLLLKSAFVTREGNIDSSDTGISPNIDHTSVKCLWSDNTGVANTSKYIRAAISSEVATTISDINTYYPLSGTFTVGRESHFSMPANGEFELLSGNGTYQFGGDISIEGPSNNVIDIQVTKSTDGGSTYPTAIFHIQRQINSFTGSRDVAFFTLSFIDSLEKGDRVRLEVENTTSTGNLTAELDSSFIISRL